MRLFLSALVTAVLASLAAQAHSPDSCPAPEPAPMRWQLVGFTEQTVDMVSGVFVLTNTCIAEFGASSRQCTTIEVVETSIIPTTLPVGSAWIRPVLSADGGMDVGSGTGNGGLLCGGWRGNVGGLWVNELGQFGKSSDCFAMRRVACCAVVP